MDNVDYQETAKFEQYAAHWWEPEGEFKTLHVLNPVRSEYISSKTKVNAKKLLDIGCGGGLLAESLAKKGALVTGLDAAQQSLETARLHALDSGLDIDYRHTTAEDYAKDHKAQFAVITCMELLEHVPDPESLIASCAQLLKSEGDLFVSTLNRNLKSYLGAIVGAEYLLGLLPKGTHDYRKFIKPSELLHIAEKHQFELLDLKGVHYSPLFNHAKLTDDPSINYIAHFRKL